MTADFTICEAFLGQCMASQSQRMKRWVNASFRVFRLSPEYGIFTFDIQQIGRLDCIIIELENAQTDIILRESPQVPLYVTDFYMVLGKSWASLTYETLRSIRQRLLSKSDMRAHWNHGIDGAFSNLERVRVAELKREIAGGGKLKSTGQAVETYVPGEIATTREEYIHGQTVLNSLIAIRPTDGSLVWHAFNVALGKAEAVCRRDLSECVLLELEKL
jgi:hypothetical protein